MMNNHTTDIPNECLTEDCLIDLVELWIYVAMKH